MINFDALHTILAMDFSQMRAKKQSEREYCASDEAIISFVDLFNTFFKQCSTKPSAPELAEYQSLMKLITERINISEVAYYTNKYRAEGETPEMAAEIAANQALTNFKGISKRMQYWAAGEEWGSSIRNAALHSQVVKKMESWWNWLHPVSSVASSLFASDAGEEVSEEGLPKKLEF